MKKSLKFISLLLVILLMLSASLAIVCYAEPEGGEAGGNEVVDDPGNDPVTPDPVTPDPVTPDPVTPDPVDPVTPDPNTGGHVDGQTGEDYNQGYENNNSDSSGNSGVYYDPEPISYGYDTGSSSEVVTSDSVTSNSELIQTPSKSSADIAPEKWSDITPPDVNTVKNESGDINFSSIKNNTSKKDDSYWILYLGYALIGLSVLGILYFIIASIVSSKAAKKAERMERRRATSRPAYYGGYEDEAPQWQEPSVPEKRTSRFADEPSGRSRRASSKADTGEVYVPRRVAKRSR